MSGIDNPLAGNSTYEKISPTAWLTAYPRIFSDIPLSKEIFIELEKSMEHVGTEVPADMKVPLLAPELEARYKLVSKLLKDTECDQVLEIASGLSPRGLEMTRANHQLQYVELELTQMARLKRQLAARITNHSGNFEVVVGSALELQDLQAATTHFDVNKPICIINEGLLRYLNFDEKAKVAANIREVLSVFGGVWITPDITLKIFLESQNETVPGKNQMMADLTKRNIEANRFEDEEHAIRFFEDQGFKVEQHGMLEVIDALVSPNNLKIPREQVVKMIGSAVVFVMRLKD